MHIIATICSKEKASGELLPASKRYLGEHIQLVENIALGQKLPFYILSGKFGLISAHEEIPFYDYYLDSSEVDTLVPILIKQISDLGIDEIDFCTEQKITWEPYMQAIRKAAAQLGVAINIIYLDTV